MTCSRCGAESGSSDAFCRECGAPQPASGDSVPTYRSRASLLRRELAILSAGLVLLLGAAFGIWYGLFYQSSPAMVVRRFMDADRDARYADEQTYVLNRWDSQAVFSAFQAARKATLKPPS